MIQLIKHIVLTVVVLFTTTVNLYSQSYLLYPNDTIQASGVFEDLQTLTISQINTSLNPIILSWEKVSSYVPANWEASICDNSACSTVLDDSGTMDPVNPTDYGFLLLHITPHVDTGMAVIRYAVWDVNSPTLKDTLTFIMSSYTVLGINEKSKSSTLLYPNPSNKEFTITTNHQAGFCYSIYDLKGSTIAVGKSTTSSITLSSEEFLNGVYTLKINGDGIIGKKIIIQH